MVARLKLKGIDGRAPPGVNCKVLLLKVDGSASGKFEESCDTVKLRESPEAPGRYQVQPERDCMARVMIWIG